MLPECKRNREDAAILTIVITVAVSTVSTVLINTLACVIAGTMPTIVYVMTTLDY